MEPERQIEKLLRAFAKKRRADGNGAFQLQPWARRRLQDEVSKRFAGPEDESLSLWQLFRRQWALLVGFALFIFLGSSLFLPALSKAKSKAKSVAAVSQLREIGVAAQMAAADNNGRLPATLGALTNGYLSRDTLTDPLSGKPFVYAAGGAALDRLETNAVLAYSLETKDQRNVLFADGSVRILNESTFDSLGLKSAKPGTGLMVLAANAPAPAAAPITSPASLNGNNLAGNDFAAKALPATGETSAGLQIASARMAVAAPAAHQLEQVFENRASPAIADKSFNFRTTNAQPVLNQDKAKTESASSVLASFELRQNGNVITIVDHDGSVYNGTITPENNTRQAVGGVVPPVATNQGQFRPGVNFRVSGENQLLKKNIVFLGEILSVSNSVASNSAANAMASPSTRITGTATIDFTNVISIDAMPVAP